MRADRGLSLIEWIMLTAIVFVLGAITVSMLVGSIRSDRKNDCRNSLKQIGFYFAIYKSKFGEYPAMGTGPDSWFAQIWRPELATDGNLFRCAKVGKAGRRTDYWCVCRPGAWDAFAFASARDLGSASAPGGLPVACDQLGSTPNHGDDAGDVNVLFLDGHVENREKSSPFVSHPPAFLGSSGWDAPDGRK